MTVGLVGFGRLGRLLVKHFAKDAKIFVADRKLNSRLAKKLGATPVAFAQACAQPIVVLCIPIAEFENTVKKACPFVKPGALVVDVCSVKEHPVKIMRRWLPKDVSILGTHPNFGPDSAADSLKGRKIVLCRSRIDGRKFAAVKKVLARKGLRLLEMTARDHDRRMAASLLLTHFVGRALIAYGAKTTGVDTEGYKRLLFILETVRNDSWQLFEDMNRFNTDAASMRRRLLAAFKSVDRKVSR